MQPGCAVESPTGLAEYRLEGVVNNHGKIAGVCGDAPLLSRSRGAIRSVLPTQVSC